MVMDGWTLQLVAEAGCLRSIKEGKSNEDTMR
jgi:hypothetical protein